MDVIDTKSVDSILYSQLSDEELVQAANELMQEFFDASKTHRQRMRENEDYWEGNHWKNKPKKSHDDPQPTTPLIFSTVQQFEAEAMDNYPSPLVLGTEKSDDEVASELTDILRELTRRSGYRKQYRKKIQDMLRKGHGVEEIIWDKSLKNGLGDVVARHVKAMNILFDPEAGDDIQNGRAVIKFEFFHPDYFKLNYPDKFQNMKADGWTIENILNDDNLRHNVRGEGDPKGTDSIMLMEFWWKEPGGKVHMAHIAGGVVLERSDTTVDTMYKHGKFPFVVTPMYQFEGSPYGMSVIDIFKPLQDYIDKADQILMRNMLASSHMKLLVNKNSGIDEADLLDWSKEVIYGENVRDDFVRWFQPQPLPNYIMTYMMDKRQLMKTESGSSEFTRGETSGSVTAASAIYFLQQAGAKKSRLMVDQIYDYQAEVYQMMIDVMAENYTEERIFRIRHEDTHEVVKTIAIKSDKLAYNDTLKDWDISVVAEKASPATAQAINNQILGLAQTGVLTDPYVIFSCLHLEGKDKILTALKEGQAQVIEQLKAQNEELAAQLAMLSDEYKKLSEQNAQNEQIISGLSETVPTRGRTSYGMPTVREQQAAQAAASSPI